MTGSPIDPNDPVQLELLRRTPQGRRLVLGVSSGDTVVNTAYVAYSPNSRVIGLAKRTGGDLGLPVIDDQRAGALFDAVVLDDVLGGSEDDCLLRALFERSADGAVLTASIRNSSHWSHMLARVGGEPVEVAGMNRARLVERLVVAGWVVVDETPVSTEPAQAPQALEALLETALRLSIPIDTARSELTTEAWVIRAVKGAARTPITIAALGMKKVAGVTDARIDHPMRALASQPFVRAAWGAGGVEIPGVWAPGILMLHRQFMDGSAFVNAMERRMSNGWIVVSEIDDDPHHWPQFVNSNFRAFRGVHAVTVTNGPLAEMVRQWNPHVEILPNAASYLPPTPLASPKGGDKIRVFFGALNREKDWTDVVLLLGKIALELADRLEFVVVHDRAFFDALPAGVDKTFSATLAIDDYLSLLATCDVALLPLNETPFNRLKSDLKFVECCAAGVVPVCSETVYGAEPAHRDVAIFARTPSEWAEALKTLALDAGELSRRRALGEAYVRAKRMHADQASRREDVFRSMMANRNALEADRRNRVAQHFS